jgi:hypothetical protein
MFDRAPSEAPVRVPNLVWFLVLCLCACAPGAREAGSPGNEDGGTQEDARVAPAPGAPMSGTPRDGGGDSAPAQPPPTLTGDVAFSVPSQTFRGELRVAMSTDLPSAEIRFTTDGSLPGASSQLFAGEALTLTSTTQLRAQAFAQGSASGKPTTALYVARTFDATSDLPIVIVDGYGAGKPTDKEVYKDAAIMIFEPIGGTASLAVPPAVATRAGYHVRGQSSQRLPQTPYRVELWDNAGEDADHALLGMPADSDWALIPPYYDRALVRNPLVYELGRELGLQAPRVAFAEVYVNYSDRPLEPGDYLGIYWVTETIKNNGARTDLKQLRETDKTLPAISGGYIFKFDQAAAEEPKIACSGSSPLAGGFGGFGRPAGMGMGGTAPTTGGTCWVDLEVVDPDPLLPEQAAWLKDYLQQFHATLHATPIGDYEAFIDVASFVDYLIINELTRNVDAYVRSAYYHKDRDGKLKAGPLWDYNFSLGVGGAGSIDPAGGWQFEGTRNVNNWYQKLTSDPAFMERVQARWAALRQGPLADAALDQRITQLVTPLTQAAVRDYAKWQVATILPSGAFVRGPSAPTWQGQVQALRDFVRARSAWMDAQWQ